MNTSRGTIHTGGSGEHDKLDQENKHNLAKRWGALRTVSVSRATRAVAQAMHCRSLGHHSHRPQRSHVWRLLPDPPLSLSALAARVGMPLLDAEAEKGKVGFPDFATGRQALLADPRCPLDIESRSGRCSCVGLSGVGVGTGRRRVSTRGQT